MIGRMSTSNYESRPVKMFGWPRTLCGLPTGTTEEAMKQLGPCLPLRHGRTSKVTTKNFGGTIRRSIDRPIVLPEATGVLSFHLGDRGEGAMHEMTMQQLRLLLVQSEPALRWNPYLSPQAGFVLRLDRARAPQYFCTWKLARERRTRLLRQHSKL